MLKGRFKSGIKVIERLEEAGYKAYFVGGCVRDLFLNRTIKDIDIATSAMPRDVIKIFDHVIPVGIEHGTVIVRYNHISFEVTTFRQDGIYSNQRHPDSVTFINDIKEDLKRRDFTMNALAMTKDGQILDYFSGQTDIKKRLIRTVGHAQNRFKEDPLRIVRALRFSSQLGFDIETETCQQMQLLAKEINTLAIERITSEMSKFFEGECINHSFSYLKNLHIDRYLPVFKDDLSLIHKLQSSLTAFYSFAEVIAVMHFLNKQISIQTWVNEWKCSNQTKREAYHIYEAIKRFEKEHLTHWLVYKLNDKLFPAFIHAITTISLNETLTTHDLIEIKDKLPIQSRSEINFNGLDLSNLFPNRRRGQWISIYLEKIERAIVEKEITNNKKEIKEWILCHPPEIN